MGSIPAFLPATSLAPVVIGLWRAVRLLTSSTRFSSALNFVSLAIEWMPAVARFNPPRMVSEYTASLR